MSGRPSNVVALRGGAMTFKPRWQGRNPREREQMVRWVHEQLDAEAEYTARLEGPAAEAAHEEYLAWCARLGPQIDAAESGDIEPLRRRLPELEKFLFAPPPRKRKKRPKHDAVTTAAWAVRSIRKIWQREYGRKNRHADDGPSAVEIAASWVEVTPPDIEKRLKPSGPSGKKKFSRAD
jgi:hypothetical protein